MFLLPPPWAVVGFGAVFTLGAWEWGGLGALRGTLPRAAYAAGVGLLLLLTWRWTADREALAAGAGRGLPVVGGGTVVAVIGSFPASRGRGAVLRPAVLVPAFVSLARLDVSTEGFVRGPQLVLWLVFLVIAADIGAYFAGRAFGRRKLAPRVSPGKTWEGAAGGLSMVALVAWAGAVHFGFSAPATLAFGCAVGIFSIIGDLTESMFKRAAGIKDSGVLLPGHGGLLDRIDSVTAAAPLYALGLFGAGVIP